MIAWQAALRLVFVMIRYSSVPRIEGDDTAPDTQIKPSCIRRWCCGRAGMFAVFVFAFVGLFGASIVLQGIPVPKAQIDPKAYAHNCTRNVQSLTFWDTCTTVPSDMTDCELVQPLDFDRTDYTRVEFHSCGDDYATVENGNLTITSCFSPYISYDDYKHPNATWIPYTGPVDISNKPYVRLSCGTGRYNSFVHFVPTPLDETEHKRPPRASEGEGKPDVALIILDSMSRAHFMRSHPRTVEFLKNLNDSVTHAVYGFNRYNGIGFNTAPSLSAMLAGSDWESVYHFRHNGWLWDRFKQQGYVTALAAEECAGDNFANHPDKFNGIGSFDLRAPSLWPCRDYVSRFGATGLFDYRTPFCVDQTQVNKVVFDWMEKFFEDKKYENIPKLGMLVLEEQHFKWMASSHQIDPAFELFLKKITERPNTVTVIVGDHGTNQDPYYETRAGKLELTLPMLSIILPKDLLAKKPAMGENLTANQKRLLTHTDLYLTMVSIPHFPDFPPLEQLVLEPSYLTGEKDLDVHINLFESVAPLDRNCHDLGVEEGICSCDVARSKLADPNDPTLVAVAESAVKIMNDHIKEYGMEEHCVRLHFGEIETATVVEVENHPAVADVTFRSLEEPAVFEVKALLHADRPEEPFTLIPPTPTQISWYDTWLPCIEGVEGGVDALEATGFKRMYCVCSPPGNITIRADKEGWETSLAADRLLPIDPAGLPQDYDFDMIVFRVDHIQYTLPGFLLRVDGNVSSHYALSLNIPRSLNGGSTVSEMNVAGENPELIVMLRKSGGGEPLLTSTRHRLKALSHHTSTSLSIEVTALAFDEAVKDNSEGKLLVELYWNMTHKDHEEQSQRQVERQKLDTTLFLQPLEAAKGK